MGALPGDSDQDEREGVVTRQESAIKTEIKIVVSGRLS